MTLREYQTQSSASYRRLRADLSAAKNALAYAPDFQIWARRRSTRDWRPSAASGASAGGSCAACGMRLSSTLLPLSQAAGLLLLIEPGKCVTYCGGGSLDVEALVCGERGLQVLGGLLAVPARLSGQPQRLPCFG